MPGELIIGLMSGTSVDGIDASLVEFESSSKLNVRACQFTPFPEPLRNRINQLALSEQALEPADYTELDDELAEHYAQAALSLISKAGLSNDKIDAIANHGQTVRHDPDDGYSLQLGNARKIAKISAIPTIAHFRQADLALGGQGAPLMPAFHKAVFASDDGTSVCILNIGGIANVSCIGESVVGFDTGPGNTLMDQWVWQHQQQTFDSNGQWAASGKVIKPLLQKLMSDRYFAQGYPKSTGTDYFNLQWLYQHVENIDSYASADVQASLLALSVESIAMAVDDLAKCRTVKHIYVCGGGANNSAMMDGLRSRLSGHQVETTEALGVAADWVESIGFAWLGYCHIHNIPCDLMSVTGASRPAVLGQLFQPA